MRKQHVLAHAMLWAAAIIVSAVLAAPVFLSLVLLPLLAVLSLQLIRRAQAGDAHTPAGVTCRD